MAASTTQPDGRQEQKDMENEEYREYEQCGCQIGCGSCKTKRCTTSLLSCFNNVKGALFFLCCIAFFQGFAMNGLINVVISTLERRFNLRSSETGLIASTYDIGSCVSLLIVSYFGGRGHKPLWLGWGTVVMALGSLVFALPHFVAPTYSISSSESFLCSNNSSNCDDTSIRAYRGFFILSQLLHGIGATPLYTLGITYMDENVKQMYSSVYHGVFYAISLIGPGLGYLLGGQLLNMYTNPSDTVSITPESPLWVGNWWIGFLISVAGFAVFSIPMMMYPRQLPGTDKVRAERSNEMHQSSDALAVNEDENFGKSFRDIPRCTLILLKNPTMVFISLGGAMDNGLIAGIATFGPKYLEAMFSLTAANAAFYFGLLAIIAACLGQLIGGIVVGKLRLTVPKMIQMCIVCSFCSLGCFLIYLITCANANIAGFVVPYNGESKVECTSVCGCSTNLYDPVCGADNLTYTSFCDAGCDRIDSTNFENCTSVLNSDKVSLLSEATVTKGKCEMEACSSLYLFIFFVALGALFVFLNAQPGLQASLRCVPFYQRSFAIGIQWLILRLLGSIPLPNILGRVLDLSCIVWVEECGDCGSCKVYDNASMSKYLVIVLTVVKALSIAFYSIAWIAYKPPMSDLDATATRPNGEVDANPAESHRMEERDNRPPSRKESEAHDNPAFDQ